MMRRAKPWANAVNGKACWTPRYRRRALMLHKPSRNAKTMSQESTKPDETPAPVGEKRRRRPSRTRPRLRQPTKSPPPSKPGKGSRLGAIIVLILIVASLAWYFVSDRLTPYTSQARVQAFVVPVAAEVSGTVLKVYVKNNDEVQPGQRLFDIDPTQYRIALAAQPFGL